MSKQRAESTAKTDANFSNAKLKVYFLSARDRVHTTLTTEKNQHHSLQLAKHMLPYSSSGNITHPGARKSVELHWCFTDWCFCESWCHGLTDTYPALSAGEPAPRKNHTQSKNSWILCSKIQLAAALRNYSPRGGTPPDSLGKTASLQLFSQKPCLSLTLGWKSSHNFSGETLLDADCKTR